MNPDTISVDFRTTLELSKSQAENDNWRITGIAAGTDVDREGDVITPEAIRQFADQINSSFVPFRDWHQENTVLADMGQVVKAWIGEDYRLGVEVELDKDHPGAQYIWRKLDKGKQFGMSVRGRSTDYKYDLDKSTGARIRKHTNVVLTEISLTTKPIYTPSLGTVLRKAVDEFASVNLIEQGVEMESNNEIVESVAEEQTPQVEQPQSSAPENDAVVDDTQEVEKSVSADTARDAKKLTKLVKLHREMAALISDLGLDSAADAEGPDGSSPVVETAKSEAETVAEVNTPDVASLMKSAIEESTAVLRAEIEALKALIPERSAPGALVSKSESVDPQQIISDLRANPRQALRLGLAARHNELDRI